MRSIFPCSLFFFVPDGLEEEKWKQLKKVLSARIRTVLFKQKRGLVGGANSKYFSRSSEENGVSETLPPHKFQREAQVGSTKRRRPTWKAGERGTALEGSALVAYCMCLLAVNLEQSLR